MSEFGSVYLLYVGERIGVDGKAHQRFVQLDENKKAPEGVSLDHFGFARRVKGIYPGNIYKFEYADKDRTKYKLSPEMVEQWQDKGERMKMQAHHRHASYMIRLKKLNGKLEKASSLTEALRPLGRLYRSMDRREKAVLLGMIVQELENYK